MTGANATRLEMCSLPVRGVTIWTFTLSERDAKAWDGERLEMIQDAFWLIRQAMQGRTEGPLMLPRLGVPVRRPEEVRPT